MSEKRAAPPPEPLPGVVDAHAHTWDPILAPDRDGAIARAWEAGLAAIIETGCDLTSSIASRDLARRDARVFPTVGLHPHEASHLEEQREGLMELLDGGDFVGVGEIGIDFYRNISTPAEQIENLGWHLEQARAHELPVIIHSRDADEECFAILEHWVKRVGRYLGPEREVGMMHCFAGDVALAQRYIDMGFLISVPGTVTYPSNERGQDVARTVPLDHMLVETDCPYLTPIPYRGGRNEPAYVAETARFVATLRGIDADEVARETAANTARLFGFVLPAGGPR